MRHLTYLDIDDGACWANHDVSPEEFTALTASDMLQELRFWNSQTLRAAMCHIAAGSNMFAVCRVLPGLTHLTIDLRDIGNRHLATSDVERLVNYCPALQRLSLTAKPEVQLHALLSLTQLRHVRLWGVTADAPSVVQLSQLAGFTVEADDGEAELNGIVRMAYTDQSVTVSTTQGAPPTHQISDGLGWGFCHTVATLNPASTFRIRGDGPNLWWPPGPCSGGKTTALCGQRARLLPAL